MRKLNKKILALLALLCLCLTAGSALAEKVTVNNADELEAALAGAATIGADIEITLGKDIDMKGVSMSNAVNRSTVVIDGKGNKILNLESPLFDRLYVGNLTVKNLTIDGAKTGDVMIDGLPYAAIIVPYADCGDSLTIDNVHIQNSTVTGSDYVGAIYGVGGGYNGAGPVYFDVLVKDSSITNCTFTGGGSTGSYFGHAMWNAWTTVKIENSSAINNTITCTDTKPNKAGDLIGTNGTGTDDKPTIEGETKTPGVFVNATTRNNTVISGGAEVHRVVGRAGSTGSNLTFTGGDYDTTREENSKFNDLPKEDLVMLQTANGLGGSFLEDKQAAMGGAAAGDLPSTGDDSSMMLWAALLGLCMAAFAVRKVRFNG